MIRIIAPVLGFLLASSVASFSGHVGAASLPRGATVEGTIIFKGSIPAPKIFEVIKDSEICGQTVSVQSVRVHKKTRALQHVVVSLQGMKKDQSSPISTAKVVFNLECAFAPRVHAAVKGYRLEIQNQDRVLHNTHIKVGRRTLLNVAQLPGSRPIIKRIKRTGLHTIRCDKHKFMSGALMVFNHPYFSVTDEMGKFQITGVPAGEQTVLVWHETLGSFEKKVVVPTQGTVTVQFHFP